MHPIVGLVLPPTALSYLLVTIRLTWAPSFTHAGKLIDIVTETPSCLLCDGVKHHHGFFIKKLTLPFSISITGINC